MTENKVPFLSVIIPVFNEEESLLFCYAELSRIFACYDKSVEYIFIDDGSRDSSYALLSSLSKQNPQVKCLQFSRNFGKEAAMTAGLDYANGEYVCQIDADLQDPPELIPQMIEHSQKNNLDVVFGVRRSREGETILKKLTAYLFYKFIKKISFIEIPEHTGDFRVMKRDVVLALRTLSESQRFMKGLFSWVGFKQGGFLYDRKPRTAGTTKFNYIKLWNFALEGITSFTNLPLKLATYVGFFIALFAFFLAAFYILKYLFLGDAIQGFLTIIVAILFIGGIQIMFLGIIGEYLGRVYFESKKRPLYLLRDKKNIQG